MQSIESGAHAIANQKAKTPGKIYLVTLHLTCPVCLEEWKFQYFEISESISKLSGFREEEVQGAKYWRVSTERFGVHCLCGKCRANNIAMHVVHKPGQNAEVKPGWTQQEEAKLRGNLKYQQIRFAAWATAKQMESEEAAKAIALIDQQCEVMRKALPEGKIAIHIDWRE